MAGKDIDVLALLGPVKIEAEFVIATIRQRGAKRFGKALGIAGLFVVAAYLGIYKPPQAKISRLQKEIDTARVMSESGTAYQELRGQLASSYGILPNLKDQQHWLSNAMIDSLRADNLTPELFHPVVETEVSGIIFQTSTVQLTIKFNDLYTWLMRIEGAKPLMHISTLDIKKRTDMLGWNTVGASMVTAIPKKRYN